MSKANLGSLRLIIPAGLANPAPPIGPALGQKGINSTEFCKEFNNKTKHFKSGVLVRADINILGNRNYDLKISPPSTTTLLKLITGVEKGDSTNKISTISVRQLYEVAKIKQSYFHQASLKSIYKMLIGSANSLGLTLVK